MIPPLLQDFIPAGHPAVNCGFDLITIKPTHVTIAYTAVEPHIIVHNCTPEMCMKYTSELYVPNFAFIWHWKNELGQPYNPGSYTDYCGGITFYRNEIELLHRDRYPAIVFSNRIGIPLDIYQHIILDFLQRNVINLNMAFNNTFLDFMWVLRTNYSAPNMPQHINKIVLKFMLGTPWYIWYGERIFVGRLIAAELMHMENAQTVAIHRLKSIIKILGNSDGMVVLIKKWAYMIGSDPNILLAECNVIDTGEIAYFTDNERGFIENC